MGKAFASPRRLELIDLLAQGPRTVEELARSDRAVHREHLSAPAGPARRRSRRPSARGEPGALRARRRRRDRALVGAAGDLRRPASPRSSAPRGSTWASPSRRSRGPSLSLGCERATSCSSTSGPSEEFEAGHIDGARLDPDRRARRAPRRAAGRRRGGRLLPRPVLRVRPRGGPPSERRRAPGAPARGGLARMEACSDGRLEEPPVEDGLDCMIYRSHARGWFRTAQDGVERPRVAPGLR